MTNNFLLSAGGSGILLSLLGLSLGLLLSYLLLPSLDRLLLRSRSPGDPLLSLYFDLDLLSFLAGLDRGLDLGLRLGFEGGIHTIYNSL